MKDWPEFVKAYHVLIAKLILSDAYALFTHHEKEDRIFLEGTSERRGIRRESCLMFEGSLKHPKTFPQSSHPKRNEKRKDFTPANTTRLANTQKQKAKQKQRPQKEKQHKTNSKTFSLSTPRTPHRAQFSILSSISSSRMIMSARFSFPKGIEGLHCGAKKRLHTAACFKLA
jgi:hypothetical protein